MRAVRLVDKRRLEEIELPPPVLAGGTVVVDVVACGICGSDLSCYKHGIFAGAVLGHEIAGIVAASADPSWAPGTRVVVDPKVPCGTCRQCLDGASHRCLDSLTRSIGQAIPGGFAEQLAAPAAGLHRVPDGLASDVAALAEPLAVALHGLALAEAAAEPAVVFGLGPIGLLAIAALRARGASPLVGVDPVGLRRDLAASLGADLTVAPGDQRIAATAPSVVIEASGHPTAIAEAGNVAAPGARVLLLGIPIGEAALWPMTWITRELRIIGSVAQTADDFEDALALLARTPAIGAIVTQRAGLSGVAAAFERLTSAPDAGKVLVTP